VFVTKDYLSLPLGTPHCYRPIATTAKTATASASIDPTSRVASLLVVSKGLPPPLLSCDCGDDVVSLDAVDVVFFAAVVVDVVAAVSPPPSPPACSV